MPDLQIPFIFHNNLPQKHKITHIELLLADKKILTGSENGDIILWFIDDICRKIQPKIYFSPSLSQNIGKLSAMRILFDPIQKITDNITTCLVTVHNDNRMRMWNTDDGRCFNISNYELFNPIDEIVEILPLKESESKFLACISQMGKLYIIDLWKMQQVKIINVSTHPIISFAIDYENKEIIMINSQNQLIFWDLIEYFQEDQNNLLYYIENQENVNRASQMYKNRMKNQVELPGNQGEKPLEFHINLEYNKIIVLFSSKLIFYDCREVLKNKIKHYLHLSFTNISDFQKIYRIDDEDSDYIFVTTKVGNMISLRIEDIEYLWDILKTTENDNLQFSYQDFSFFKEKDNYSGFLTLNGYKLIYNSVEEEKQIANLSKFQGKKFQFSTFDEIYKVLVTFNPIDNSLQFYQCGTELKKFKSKIKIINKDLNYPQDNKDIQLIKSRSKAISLYEKNVGRIFTLQKKQETFKPYIVYSLKIKENCLIKEIFHSIFFKYYQKSLSSMQIFEGDEIIAVNIFAQPSKGQLLHIIGSNRGQVYIFPAFFYDNKKSIYKYYYHKNSTNAIEKLYFEQDLLIICDQTGFLTMYNIDLEFLDNMQHNQQNINLQKPDAILPIDFSALKQNSQQLINPIKRILKIHKIILEVYQNEESDYKFEEESYTEVDGSHNDWSTQNLALVLKNNGIAILNKNKGKVSLLINDNTNIVHGVFYHPLYDYLLILNQNGSLNIYSINQGSFIQSIDYQSLLHLFPLQNKIQTHQKQFQDLNDFNYFRKKFNKKISQPMAILEFGQRFEEVQINYFNDQQLQQNDTPNEQISAVDQERLGSLQKVNIQKQSIGSQLLWMLLYDQSMNFEANNDKSGLIVRKIKVTQNRSQNFGEIGNVLIFDCKKNSHHIKRKQNQEDLDQQEYISYLPLVFLWGIEVQLDQKISELTMHQKPVFKFNEGIKGIGESFSFVIGEQDLDMWRTSSYMTTQNLLSIILYFTNSSNKQNIHLISQLMQLTTDQLFKKKQKICKIDIQQLCKRCLDDSNEMLTACCNLIVVSLMKKEFEGPLNSQICSQLFDYNYEYLKQSKTALLSRIETIWILLYGYVGFFLSDQYGKSKLIYQRILEAINLRNCLIHPIYLACILKVLIDGIQQQKIFLNEYNVEQTLENTIYLYFHYSILNNENIEKLNNPKYYSMLPQFAEQSKATQKHIRTMLIKTLIASGSQCLPEFIYVLKKEVLNSEIHPFYPYSIIDVIKHFVKAQKIAIQKKLINFVEIILKSLDPGNPQIRNNCHQIATQALFNIIQFYKNISFNQSQQLIAITHLENQIVLFDLRTATKLKQFQAHDSTITTLSFDHSGNSLASFSQGDSNLKIWRIGGTGLFSSLLSWQDKPIKVFKIARIDLDLENSCENSVQVIWDNSDNKVTLKQFNTISSFDI